MATVGDLVVKMTVDNGEYVAGLRDSQARLEAMQATVARANAQANTEKLAMEERIRLQHASRVATEHAAAATQKQAQWTAFFVDVERREAAAVNAAAVAHRNKNMAMGRGNMLISNAVFMVEDAASVYGTMGLAGSIRAASNNLTMMAMVMGGPWGAAVAVAVTTVTQLWMAFGKSTEATKKQGEAWSEAGKQADKLRAGIDATIDALRRQADLARELRDVRESKDPRKAGESLQDFLFDVRDADMRVKAHEQARESALAAARREQSLVNDVSAQEARGGGLFATSGLAAQREAAEQRRNQHLLNAKKLEEEMVSLVKERDELQSQMQQRWNATLAARANADRERNAKNIEENRALAQKQFDEQRKVAERASQVAGKLFDTARETRKRAMKSDVDRQIADIVATNTQRLRAINNSALDASQKDAMRAQLAAAMRNDLSGLADSLPRDALRKAGPSMALRGSREDLEQERQRLLNRQAPKEQTPDLLKKLLDEAKAQGKLEQQQADYAKKLYEAATADSGSIL